MSKAGQSGSGERKTQLAVGKDGAFRVEQELNGVSELRMSDGKVTWKVLPKEKLWSKHDVAQSVGTDDTDEDMAGDTMG